MTCETQLEVSPVDAATHRFCLLRAADGTDALQSRSGARGALTRRIISRRRATVSRKLTWVKIEQAYEQMKQLSAQTYVPTFVAGDKVLANFDTDQLEKFLSEHQINPRKSVPDAFWRLSYTWRSRAQRRLAQFSEFVCTKGRRARNSRCHFSRRLFYHRQLDVGFRRRDELALSAVAGNSHSHSRASASEGKTASAEKSALFGHVPSARAKSRARSRTKGSSTSATPAGIGKIIGSFSGCFIREEDRAQAAICLNEQRDFSFYYLRISSRAKGGTVWTTWNYPLSYGLEADSPVPH